MRSNDTRDTRALQDGTAWLCGLPYEMLGHWSTEKSVAGRLHAQRSILRDVLGDRAEDWLAESIDFPYRLQNASAAAPCKCLVAKTQERTTPVDVHPGIQHYYNVDCPEVHRHAAHDQVAMCENSVATTAAAVLTRRNAIVDKRSDGQLPPTSARCGEFHPCLRAARNQNGWLAASLLERHPQKRALVDRLVILAKCMIKDAH